MMRFKTVLMLALIAMTISAAQAAPRLDTVEYKQTDGQPLLMDISQPEGAEGELPVVVIVHGGGWGAGDRKTMITPVLETLTKGGCVWASMDYRLSPASQWPACLEDVEDALAWVKENIEQYHGDPERIAILGYSAGGQLAFWTAIHDKGPHKVKALIGLAPATDFLEDIGRRGGASKALRALFGVEKAPDAEVLMKLYDCSPINGLTAGLPPILLIHGTDDMSVPFQQSLNIQRKLKEMKSGVPCEIYKIKGAPHRQSEWDDFDAGYKKRLNEWLKENL